MAFLLIAVAAPSPAAAGLIYDFTTTVETPRSREDFRGRVWTEGASYRAEVTRPDGSRQVVISTDADETAFTRDMQTETWTERARTAPVRSASIFLFPVGFARVKGKPSVTHVRETAPPIAGHDVALHRVEAKFGVESRVGESGVRGKFRVVARIWTAEALPPLPMRSALRTGYPQVDEKLDNAMKHVAGMVLRHELEVVRTLEGGPPQTEKTVTAVTHLEQGDVDPALFSID
jgi:hypothetical protein